MQTADRQQHQQQQESFSSAVSSTEENVAKDWDNNNKASSLVDTTDEMESEVNGCKKRKTSHNCPEEVGDNPEEEWQCPICHDIFGKRAALK